LVPHGTNPYYFHGTNPFSWVGTSPDCPDPFTRTYALSLPYLSSFPPDNIFEEFVLSFSFYYTKWA
jgi:hypothetical protein